MPKQNEVDSMSYTTYNIGERLLNVRNYIL